MSYTNEDLLILRDSDLLHVIGGIEPASSQDWTKQSSTINPRALGAAAAAGAVTGGLGAAAISGGPGWPAGAAGGALLGGIAYSVENAINPPAQEPIQPSSTLSWGEDGFRAYG